MSDPQEKKTSISLIVPALNEESNLPILLAKCVQEIPNYFGRYEIIVVDDGSRDRTAETVQDWIKKDPNIVLIRHPENMGVGSVLKDGFKKAQYEWVFQIPGDNQFDIAEVREFIPLLQGADIVQGWRTNLNYTPRRKAVTWIYRTLLRALFGLKLKDPTWVKMIRTEIVRTLPITTDGFFGEIEILIRAKRQGYRFSEAGVHTQKRLYGESSATSPFRVLKTFLELIMFRLRITFKE